MGLFIVNQGVILACRICVKLKRTDRHSRNEVFHSIFTPKTTELIYKLSKFITGIISQAVEGFDLFSNDIYFYPTALTKK